ncbi:ATP-grasp peptide maturase system methyltransferase [Kitasatospora phosalacinea]|uniref:Protein-L-isoaspartate O-methyltransferase n=1 Tax=Kitasatospora phosalacinea TaxID=2065 RepID=A0A9W6PDM7_9ACTN|nr:ATP-grasp peptide maturase system methyltransferase [Kitasatospora phosalacinea]GLW53990.1 protein-L-isoaspartate O-methyltransferase [Kitasatospora phosalacinea]
MTTSDRLRTDLVAQLIADGELTDPEWVKAASAVPREKFAPAYFLAVDGSTPTSYIPVDANDDGWLEGVYTNQTLITQLAQPDGTITATDAGRLPVVGEPSSSSTLPSLVLNMWQLLGVEDGHRVLEIGTGTGYSTALGAHRLGDENLTSIEYDPVVAELAAAAIEAAGYSPRLVVGDGLLGDPAGETYDRLIATCAVRYVPQPWLYQVRPGGRILATIGGWGHGFGLADLTVTAPGEATGRFLPGFVNFMIARPHGRPPRPSVALLPGNERQSILDPALLDTWTGRWVGQLAAPSAERLGAGTDQILWDVATGSQARTTANANGGWTVTQRGPLRLWDKVEDALFLWRTAGEPHQEKFGITITPTAQTVWLETPDGPNWNLPI